MNMKLSDYLVFVIPLVPTLVLAVAAVVSVAWPDPEPVYRPPLRVDVLGKPVVR